MHDSCQPELAHGLWIPCPFYGQDIKKVMAREVGNSTVGCHVCLLDILGTVLGKFTCFP